MKTEQTSKNIFMYKKMKTEIETGTKSCKCFTICKHKTE